MTFMCFITGHGRCVNSRLLNIILLCLLSHVCVCYSNRRRPVLAYRVGQKSKISKRLKNIHVMKLTNLYCRNKDL